MIHETGPGDQDKEKELTETPMKENDITVSCPRCDGPITAAELRSLRGRLNQQRQMPHGARKKIPTKCKRCGQQHESASKALRCKHIEEEVKNDSV